MRADRLVSLVLLLRQRGRMTAAQLAGELEVSPRTVLRDIEALSTAGVPVYADRGRHGGYSLLEGFRTELTGLSHDEALALLAATSSPVGIGLAPRTDLGAAMRKALDALPDSNRSRLDAAASRLLIEPETDLLSRRAASDDISVDVLRDVRGAVLAGHRLRLRYAAPGAEPSWRTVDPIGLVTVRDRTYLLALRSGEDRTYRLSRVLAAERSPDRARRPDDVDLARLWRERAAAFLSEDHIAVTLRVAPSRREELLASARAVRAEAIEADGSALLEVMFEDLRHALWAAWQLDTDAEVLAPAELRRALRDRAETITDRYRPQGASRPPRSASPAAGPCIA